MVEFARVIGPLSGVLGLSLVVERVLEFFKNIVEPRLGGANARQAAGPGETQSRIEELRYHHELAGEAREIDKNPKELAERLTALTREADAEQNAEKKKKILEKMRDLKAVGEWDEQFPMSRVLVQPASDADDGTTMRVFVLQLSGFAAGIILARFSGIALFQTFLAYAGPIAWWDYVLTGLLIGGGSAPMHLLIRFITERKVSAAAEEPGADISRAAVPQQSFKTAGAPGPAIITAPSDNGAESLNIPYSGGVDRDLLEDVHLREKDPDMVVLHHTAMSSRSTFEDVVNVIKNRTDSRGRKWLTGYNCVVLADGSVHAFCRWDRYGSHAVGYNQRSLGLSFNGNFETDPKVSFSNPNGKYGPPRPTEEQVKAGARIVALWTFLYPGIQLDFEKSILPHGKLADKACPGNMFPHDEFRKWTEFYEKKWRQSQSVQEQLEAFRHKPYLFVKGAQP